MSVQDPLRALKPSEAAWLARVNDDRVREWFRDTAYPAPPGGVKRTTTTWEELRSFCALKGKPAPLPVEFLDIDVYTAMRLLADEPSGLSAAAAADLRRRLKQAELREDGLRRALREQIRATTEAVDALENLRLSEKD